jgi:outer membrane protein OmpA-like peptidoglycan-associated protein
MDNLDSCITIVGPAANNGCPYGDKDGDTILDNADPCPDVPGPVENSGCPYGDKDGDEIKDDVDKCPEIPGPVDNDGCPYVDSDQDGTIDKDDLCPRTPGPIDNQGCPVIKKEEQEVLNTAFDNLEFESGSDIIKGKSYLSLDNLADLLKTKADWKLKVSGHTDDVGSESTNLRLSEKRSKSVKAYLSNRGISDDRFIVKWYGESRPIYPNSTAEGRQKNRRVEMEVMFE